MNMESKTKTEANLAAKVNTEFLEETRSPAWLIEANCYIVLTR